MQGNDGMMGFSTMRHGRLTLAEYQKSEFSQPPPITLSLVCTGRCIKTADLQDFKPVIFCTWQGRGRAFNLPSLLRLIIILRDCDLGVFHGRKEHLFSPGASSNVINVRPDSGTPDLVMTAESYKESRDSAHKGQRQKI